MLRIENIEGVIWDMDGVLHPYRPFAQSLEHYNMAAVRAFNIVAGCDYGIYPCVALGIARQSFEDYGLSTKQFTDDFQLDPVEMHLEFHRQMELERLISSHLDLADAFERMSHLKHVILSQGSREWVERCIETNGLRKYFNDASIVAFEDGIELDVNGKPVLAKKSQSELPHRLAIEASGLKPQNLVLVEDMAKNLIIARDKFGMQTVFVEESGLEPEWLNLPSHCGHEPDLHVKTTMEFVKHLARVPA